MVRARLLLSCISASLTAAHVIELSGDSTSTYISGDGASIDFAIGSEEAVKATVTSDGKVGIGINPTRTLHISDANGPNLQLDRPGFDGKLYFESDGTDGIVRAYGGSAGLRFQVDTNTHLQITSGGEVVIGGSLKWSAASRGDGEILGHNLLVNGGAETGLLSGWTSRIYYGAADNCGGGVSVNSAGSLGAPYEGDHMFYLSNCNGLVQTPKLHTGAKYTFSVWSKVHLSGYGGDGSAGRLRVVFKGNGYDENANTYAKNCYPNNYDVSPNLYKWTQCFIHFTVPEITNVDLLDTEIWIESFGRTHSINFDNVMLNRGHVVSAYSEKYDPGSARRSLHEEDTEKIKLLENTIDDLKVNTVALQKTIHHMQAHSDALLQRVEALENKAKL